MGHKRPEVESSSDDDSDISDEDRQLQEAFAKGLLKPGLNQVIEKSKKVNANNVADMKLKIKELKLKLPWVETLDLINDPAPMAPDVALQLQETTQRQINIRENNAKIPSIDIADDPVLNEFKRETLFHRQAQASAIEAVQKLHALGIVTKRPDIYFAEMAKTDVHMQKVRQNLMAKQAGQARAEKVRQLRQQKKMGKQLQAQTRQNRALEKKSMLNEVKKYRKGLKDQGDAFEDHKPNKKAVAKRNMKEKKFGFGGKKKGSKLNTRESSSDFSDLHKKNPRKNKQMFKGGKKGVSGGKVNKNKRPGKARRVNFKSKSKK